MVISSALSLQESCIQVVTKNRNQLVQKLSFLNPKLLHEVLSRVSLEDIDVLQCCISIESDQFWKKASIDTFRSLTCDVENHGYNWKRLFFENMLQNILQGTWTKPCDEEEFLQMVNTMRDHVFTLNAVELSQHSCLDKVCSLLPNLTTINVKYDLSPTHPSISKSKMEHFRSECIANLGRALQSTKCLCSLTLSNSQLDDDLLRLLVTSMSKGIDKRQDGLRNTLVHLDISHNKISTDGLHIILNYFFENKEFRTDTSSGSIHGSKKKGNDVLSILNLANNLIEAEGGRTLGRILRSDTSLASLNINLNRLGDKGCQMLLDGLRTNTTLKDLYIASNSLSNGAIQSLCSILSRDFCKGKSQYKKKCVLETVDLSCNAIKEDDTVRLATATSATTNLTALDLRYQSKIESSEMYVKTLDQIKRNLHRNEDHNQ